LQQYFFVMGILNCPSEAVSCRDFAVSS